MPKVPQTISEEDVLQPISSPDSFSDFFKVICKWQKLYLFEVGQYWDCGGVGSVCVDCALGREIALWFSSSMGGQSLISLLLYSPIPCSLIHPLQHLAPRRKAIAIDYPILETEALTTYGGESGCKQLWMDLIVLSFQHLEEPGGQGCH